MILLLALAALAGVLYLGFSPAATPAAVSQDGGAYIEGVAGIPQSLNPLLSQYNELDRDLCALIFEGLTDFDARGEIVPRLAHKWEITPNGLTYTFYLREDARWHDGAPFDADDVLYTYGVMADADFQALDASGLFDMWTDIKVEKVGDYTVKFTLPEPYAPFLDYTTIGLLPAHLLSKVEPRLLSEAQFNARPVGTGPFKVVSVNAQQITLGANTDYYAQRPRLDSVTFRFYPDAESLLPAYQKGAVAGISQVTPAMLTRLRSERNLRIYSARLAKYTMVLYNLNSKELPFFQQVEVRQALNYATDRAAIVRQVLGGQGEPAYSPFIPDTWAYDAQAVLGTYDLDKAKQLLEKAGWTDTNGDGVREKDGRKLQFTLLTSDDATWTRVAQELSRQWTALGVQVAPEAVSFSRLVGQFLYPRRFEAILIAPEFAGDPDPYPFWHSTQAVLKGQNWSGFVHRRADEVMEQARATHDMPRRLELYREFQRIFAEQAPALTLYYPIYSYAIDARVQNVQVAPMTKPSDRFRTITQWTAPTR
jgi:peptide/nickel transport system substrate-binding protein